MPRAIALIAVLFSTAAASASTGAPPTDAQVAAAVKAYQSGRTESSRPYPLVDEALKDLAIDEMSVAQLESLGIMLDLASPALRTRFRACLEKLSAAPDADGAAAAAQLPRLIEMPPDGAPESAGDDFDRARADAIIGAVDHPGFPAAVRSGRATGVYVYYYFYAENERVAASGIGARMGALVDDSWPASRIDDLLAFTQAIIAPGAGVERTEVDRVREIASRRAQKVIADPQTDEQTRTGLLEAVAAINTASARGELIGNAAPPMTFIWTRGPQSPKSLSDLKGMVVVMDFWATWCGPCIAAFPHMREMQARYAKSPVALLGVTGLQGWILDPKAANPAKRRRSGLSEEEKLRLLEPWVTSMNMTWTVAVSREKVFNADYGVRGLPTVVIIDAKGVVRHADLSPNDPELEDKIDALLREARAEVPARSESKNK